MTIKAEKPPKPGSGEGRALLQTHLELRTTVTPSDTPKTKERDTSQSDTDTITWTQLTGKCERSRQAAVGIATTATGGERLVVNVCLCPQDTG